MGASMDLDLPPEKTSDDPAPPHSVVPGQEKMCDTAKLCHDPEVMGSFLQGVPRADVCKDARELKQDLMITSRPEAHDVTPKVDAKDSSAFALDLKLKLVALEQQLITRHEEELAKLRKENHQLRRQLQAHRKSAAVGSIPDVQQHCHADGAVLSMSKKVPEHEETLETELPASTARSSCSEVDQPCTDIVVHNSTLSFPKEPNSEQDSQVSKEIELAAVLEKVQRRTTNKTPDQRWESLVIGALEDAEGLLRRLEKEDKQPLMLEFLPQWNSASTCRRGFALSSSTKLQVISEHKHGDILLDTSCLQHFMMHPHGWPRIVWGLVSALMILWDLITIPLQAYSLMEEVPALNNMTYIVFGWWVADFCMQFFLGVDTGGVVDLRVKTIIKSVLSSWFIPDLAILTVDVVLFALEGQDGDNLESVKLVRIFRLMRLARLLRLRKIVDMFNLIMSMIRSQYFALLIKILKLLTIVLLINHYIACMWYMAALIGGEPNWVTNAGLQDEPMTTLYLSALHWALTQFSPATNNVGPRNAVERIFAISVVVFAFVVFSSFVSAVTNSVQELRSIGLAQLRKENVLREFFSVRSLSTTLWFHIQMYHRNKNTHFVLTADQVELLQEMPVKLQLRLHEELFMHHLMGAPFMFEEMDVLDGGSILAAMICHKAMKELNVCPMEHIFMVETRADRALLCTSGSTAYYCNGLGDAGLALEDDDQSWFCDMALWVHWEHQGQLNAQSFCDLISIDSHQFASMAAKEGGTIFVYLRMMGLLMVACMEAEEATGGIITDMSLGFQRLQPMASRAWKYAKFVTKTSTLQLAEKGNNQPLRVKKKKKNRRSFFGSIRNSAQIRLSTSSS